MLPAARLAFHHPVPNIEQQMTKRIAIIQGELSETNGISIIDVDTIVARHGADALKLDAVHLKPIGYRLLAEEVVRVLEDVGILNEAAP